MIKTKMSSHKNSIKHQCNLHWENRNVKSTGSNREKCPRHKIYKDFLGYLATQQPTQELTTPQRIVVPKIRNWRQWTGITANIITNNDARSSISVSFIINCWTRRSCQNLREKNKYSIGQDCRKTQSRLSTGVQIVRNVQERPGRIIFHLSNGELFILFTRWELVSWDFCHYQMEINISLSLEIVLQNGTKQYPYQIK